MSPVTPAPGSPGSTAELQAFGSNISLSHSQPFRWLTSQLRVAGSRSCPQPIANAHSMIQVPDHPVTFSCLHPHKPLPPASLSTHPPCASLSNGPRHRSLPHARSSASLPRMGTGVTQFPLAHLGKENEGERRRDSRSPFSFALSFTRRRTRLC